VLLKEVDRVNRIIEMLLDLGRPVALRPVPLNIHQLLERVALMSEGTAAERGVTIVRRYDPSMPPILADEDRILQVFHNLVRNAMEAMPRGGRLTLVTRLSMNPLFAKMDLGRGLKSMAEVQVTDEGEGIPEATRAKLFTPFFTTKDTGLGWGSPSVTASWRSIGAPFRSRVSSRKVRPSHAFSRSPGDPCLTAVS
jgi:two-component system nitrogen regulation sensor histidine kinase GlnL